MLARGGFPDAGRALSRCSPGRRCSRWRSERPTPRGAPPARRYHRARALALIAATSAAWTIGDAADALQYALVIAGYGALATTAAVIARGRSGRTAVYGTIAGLAAVSGLVGLIGASVQEFPYGQRTVAPGRPPARSSTGPRTRSPDRRPADPADRDGRTKPLLALAGAGGAAIAGAVVGLSASFFAEVAGVAVLALAVAFPAATIGRPRRFALAAALLVAAAALGAHLVAAATRRRVSSAATARG